ncbi:hypothetical protein Lal_00028344 [Lupinus albus]|nr:hypothetical protein Lal_00028344 [Lupinus albus]
MKLIVQVQLMMKKLDFIQRIKVDLQLQLIWTASNQNKGYMVVATNCIDDSWVLQSPLVRFIYLYAPHTSEVLSDCLYECILDWNLDRKSSTHC